jgi:hypothetical protein
MPRSVTPTQIADPNSVALQGDSQWLLQLVQWNKGANMSSPRAMPSQSLQSETSWNNPSVVFTDATQMRLTQARRSGMASKPTMGMACAPDEAVELNPKVNFGDMPEPYERSVASIVVEHQTDFGSQQLPARSSHRGRPRIPALTLVGPRARRLTVTSKYQNPRTGSAGMAKLLSHMHAWDS